MGDVAAAGASSGILVVCGLVAEARIAAGPGIETLCSGGDAAALERTLREKAPQISAILSFGIAGGLSPHLKTGRVVLADAAIDDGVLLPTDGRWTDALAQRLPGATRGLLLGANNAVATIDEKRRLFADTGALGVDMESHIVARIGATFSLPVAVLRVISDPATRALPPAALLGMRPDGTPDIPAVLGSLLRDPGQLPALITTALEVGQALRTLKQVRRSAGEVLVSAPGDGRR